MSDEDVSHPSFGWKYFYDNDELSDRTLIIIEEKPLNFPSPSDSYMPDSNDSDSDRIDSCESDFHVDRDSQEHRLGSIGHNHTGQGAAQKVTELKIHSIVFCAKSRYFKQLFLCSGMKETQQTDVKIHLSEGETEAFLVLCKLLYCDQSCLDDVTNESSLIFNVMKMADRFMCDSAMGVLLDRASATDPTNIESLNNATLMFEFLKSITMAPELSCKVNKFQLKLYQYIGGNLCPIDSRPIDKLCMELSYQSLLLLLDADLIAEDENSILTFVVHWLQLHKDDIDFSTAIPALLEKVHVVELRPSFLITFIGYYNETLGKWRGYPAWYSSVLESHYVHASAAKTREYYADLGRPFQMRFVQSSSKPSVDPQMSSSSRIFEPEGNVKNFLSNGILFSMNMYVQNGSGMLVFYAKRLPCRWPLQNVRVSPNVIRMTVHVDSNVSRIDGVEFGDYIRWMVPCEHVDVSGDVIELEFIMEFINIAPKIS